MLFYGVEYYCYIKFDQHSNVWLDLHCEGHTSFCLCIFFCIIIFDVQQLSITYQFCYRTFFLWNTGKHKHQKFFCYSIFVFLYEYILIEIPMDINMSAEQKQVYWNQQTWFFFLVSMCTYLGIYTTKRVWCLTNALPVFCLLHNILVLYKNTTKLHFIITILLKNSQFSSQLINEIFNIHT